jgi:hypothetical protein
MRLRGAGSAIRSIENSATNPRGSIIPAAENTSANGKITTDLRNSKNRWLESETLFARPFPHVTPNIVVRHIIERISIARRNPVNSISNAICKGMKR